MSRIGKLNLAQACKLGLVKCDATLNGTNRCQSQSWPLIVPTPETQMVGVQIRLVKKLQTKLQTTNRTILKYDNEIIFVPSFISIGSFYAPAVFVRKHEILNNLNRENHLICKFRP